jgi:hypothetical protein
MADAAPLIPKQPPRFKLGEVVVYRGFEDGWRWTIVDAVIKQPKVYKEGKKAKGRGKPTWFYLATATRPYDGVEVSRWHWQFKLAPLPAEVTGASQA